MKPSCLLLCLWRERLDKSSVERDRALAELESFFFFTLKSWTSMFVASWCVVFMIFLVLFSPSSSMFLLYIPCALE
jgi:hypothetical protein